MNILPLSYSTSRRQIKQMRFDERRVWRRVRQRRGPITDIADRTVGVAIKRAGSRDAGNGGGIREPKSRLAVGKTESAPAPSAFDHSAVNRDRRPSMLMRPRRRPSSLASANLVWRWRRLWREDRTLASALRSRGFPRDGFRPGESCPTRSPARSGESKPSSGGPARADAHKKKQLAKSRAGKLRKFRREVEAPTRSRGRGAREPQRVSRVVDPNPASGRSERLARMSAAT